MVDFQQVRDRCADLLYVVLASETRVMLGIQEDGVSLTRRRHGEY